MRPHLPLLIDAALKISLNQDFGLNLRELTMLFLEQVGETYSSWLTKKAGNVMIERIMETAFTIASEAEDNADYEEGEETPH